VSARRAAALPPARYDTAQAARIVGVPAQRVRRYVGTGLLNPARDPRGRLRFAFLDLVLLKTMRGLLEKRVPMRQIARVLDSLRRQLGSKSLSEISVYVDGARVIACEGSRRWQPDSGQLLFNFDATQLAARARKVVPFTPPPPKVPTERGVTADDWYDLGVELEETSPREARTAYETAVGLDPDHVAARIDLGRMLHDDGELGAAEQQYREATKREPANGLAWYDLGVVLEDLHRSAEALLCYERAVNADPDLADAHYNLALLYEQSGREREAVRHFLIYRKLERR
jgi:tetratricopeptide (TPR) repeat protein